MALHVAPGACRCARSLLVRAGLSALLALLSMPLSVQAQPVKAPGWVHLGIAGQHPPARAQYGMAADPFGNVYVYGGRDQEDNTLDDFWRLAAGAHSWSQLPGGPPQLIEPHLVADAAGDIFEFGGLGSPADVHITSDGHSFGLYEFSPARNTWSDLTPAGVRPDADWPLGREDHGFVLDPVSGDLIVFAGEGPGLVTLNDMWSYDPRLRRWQRMPQHYAAPGGEGIDPREIYNISYDNHGGFYLFGGAYLRTPGGQPARWKYVNDLWRYDLASHTWRLYAGQANAYDPDMPMPRHYYGQACDLTGNFYVLGGYVSDTADPPYFNDDAYSLYAQLIVFEGADQPNGNFLFALDDFWQYDIRVHRWVDRSDLRGDLGSGPGIPYVMVALPGSFSFLTFGGYRLDSEGLLAESYDSWTLSLAAPNAAGVPSATAIAHATLLTPTATVPATATIRPATPDPTPSATPAP